jgi:hypothetical protein
LVGLFNLLLQKPKANQMGEKPQLLWVKSYFCTCTKLKVALPLLFAAFGAKIYPPATSYEDTGSFFSSFFPVHAMVGAHYSSSRLAPPWWPVQ